MVIGYDGSRAFLKDKTGTENYSYQLLKALAKVDIENSYLVYVRPGYSSSQPSASNNKNWPKNFKFKTIPWERLWTQGGLAAQTFKDKLDVLFVPAHTIPLIKNPKLKTVVTVHDLGSEYLPQTHQLKQRLYLGFMQKHQLKNATKLIAVSKATKKDLVKRLGIDSKKIAVVYEGYDKELFKPIKTDIQSSSLNKFSISFGKYFLFVGTVQPRKNLDRLIKVFAQICHSGAKRSEAIESRSYRSANASLQDDKIKLAIVGAKGWLSDEIYDLPKKLGIEDRVKFLGRVEDKDLPALYSGALALSFPSLFEGFGLSIIEAQACGCPVLTSNVSSMPEVAGKGAILVDPSSEEDILKGMKEILDKSEREKIIRQGFENIKRFSWEKCARETLQVLESVRRPSLRGA